MALYALPYPVLSSYPHSKNRVKGTAERSPRINQLRDLDREVGLVVNLRYDRQTHVC